MTTLTTSTNNSIDGLLINGKNSYLLEYREAIKTGLIVVGREMQQTLDNLLVDLDNTDWYYDTTQADKRIAFIERYCKHTKAPFFRHPFKLMLWEKAFIEAFYSFKWTQTGLRRFKRAVLLIARKNGKSTFCAALALSEMMCGSGGVDIICASNDDAQSGLIFDEISHMCEYSGVIKKRVRKNIRGIFYDKMKSTVKRLTIKTQNKEGRNIDVGIVDETHEMPDNSIVKPIEQSQSTKPEPIMIEITTEGFINDGYLDQRLDYCRKVLNGRVEDFELLVWLYTQDNEAEIWQDETTWQKSNPSVGEVKTYNYLRGQVRLSAESKSDKAYMLAKDFNIKQNNAQSWLTEAEIINPETFDLSILRGCFAIGGVDLAETTDLAAAKIVVMKWGSPKKYVLQKYFIPKVKLDTVPDEDRAKYVEWVKDGKMIVTDDISNDFRLITQWFVKYWSDLGLRYFKIGYDNWHAKSWVEEMEKTFSKDIMERVRMDGWSLSDPMKACEGELRAKNIIYNADPIDEYCLKNTSMKVNNYGQIMPVKVQGKADKKIDGTMALIISMAVLARYRSEYMKYVEARNRGTD